ncbi:hypothetical protein KAX02_03520 [candidate division WOR-3 bacterium]|nr:hypothetical protein [candidate division WOR-3 bacterium]
MEKQERKTEDIDISEFLAAGRDLEEIANAKREVESMRLVYGVREKLMHQLDAKERRIIDAFHLDDVRKKGGSE